MLALVTDLAIKMVTQNNFLVPANVLGPDDEPLPRVLAQTPGVVLIDELDVHLHPKWQRGVVESLRSVFPRLQFITTTHSPFIVQSLREDELINLQGQSVRQLGKLSVVQIASGLMGVERPEVGQRYQQMVAAAKDYLITLGGSGQGTCREASRVLLRCEPTALVSPRPPNGLANGSKI